jgi:hypothetical protein
MEFGQAYCKNLLKGNPWKFILYFCELYTKCYKFWKSILFFGIYLNGNRKWKRITTPQAELAPRRHNRRTAHGAAMTGSPPHLHHEHGGGERKAPRKVCWSGSHRDGRVAWRWWCVTPTFCKNEIFCANRSAYKNAYQIIVLVKNLTKIILHRMHCMAWHIIFF